MDPAQSQRKSTGYELKNNVVQEKNSLLILMNSNNLESKYSHCFLFNTDKGRELEPIRSDWT